jgi:hypothetical protein
LVLEGLNIAGFVVGVLGLIPIWILARESWHGRRPIRRILGFDSPHGIEIIVTTSHTGISKVGPPGQPHALRSLIPSGDLAGVAELCAMIARGYPKRAFFITPSISPQDDRRKDQLLVGGPVHNHYTQTLICGRRADARPSTEIVFDADQRYIRLGEKEWGPNLDLSFSKNIPQRDYAVILLTRISRYGTKQRVIAVGGLTTYGTLAAAQFLVHELPQVCDEHGLRKSPNLCLLLQARIVNGQPYDLRTVHWIPVAEIGAAD